MLEIAVVSLLFGAGLGFKFHVQVLATAVFLGVILTLGIAVSHGDDTWSTLTAAALCVTASEMGYFLAAAIRVICPSYRTGTRSC
jgi:hypothetical protein